MEPRDNYNFLHVPDKKSDQTENWPDMFWQSLAKASYPAFSLALRAESLGTSSLVLRPIYSLSSHDMTSWKVWVALQDRHPDFAKIVDSVLKTAILTKRGSLP